MEDATFGKLLVTTVLLFFTYIFVWLILIPFVQLEQEHWIYIIFPDPQWILILFSLIGVTFISVLMIFTYCHIKPYLSITNKWILIGISGVTNGGKTTLANELKEKLTPVYVLNQDFYFYPDDHPNHVKVKGLDHNNYDVLTSLNMEAMHQDILDTISGKSDKSQSKSTETNNKLSVKDKSFLIVEGFTILNYEPIREMCDLKFYISLDYEECLARRNTRVYDPPDVEGYFDLCVWPEYLRYKAELEADDSICFIDGRMNGICQLVIDMIKDSFC